jgi:hypothetical protein
MTVGTVVSQGTELFFVDTVTTTDPTIVKMACPTGITGLGGPKDEIEDTCLDNTTDKTFKAGLGNPGDISVPFNLVPRDGSHQNLFTILEAGTVLNWIECLSESATDPTIDTDGAFVAPADRSSFAFQAFIKDVNIDVATNDLVRGTLTLKRSGSVTFTAYTPA